MNRFLNVVIGWYIFALSAMAACLATIYLRLAPQLNDALWIFLLALFTGEVAVRLSLFYAARRQRRHLLLGIAAGVAGIVLASVALYQAVVALS
jgi:hypothetical protein